MIDCSWDIFCIGINPTTVWDNVNNCNDIAEPDSKPNSHNNTLYGVRMQKQSVKVRQTKRNNDSLFVLFDKCCNCPDPSIRYKWNVRRMLQFLVSGANIGWFPFPHPRWLWWMMAKLISLITGYFCSSLSPWSSETKWAKITRVVVRQVMAVASVTLNCEKNII